MINKRRRVTFRSRGIKFSQSKIVKSANKDFKNKFIVSIDLKIHLDLCIKQGYNNIRQNRYFQQCKSDFYFLMKCVNHHKVFPNAKYFHKVFRN